MATIISVKKEFTELIKNYQNKIIAELERLDGKALFQIEPWEKEDLGNGLTAVIQQGNIFEKGGVNTSFVGGKLPPALQQSFNVAHENYFACGISCVIHPYNPHCPTIHFNYRYFELYDHNGAVADAWFGGGTDLTPYYIYTDDAVHFHESLQQACNQVNSNFYTTFKKNCDQYFHNTHRGETRGIGGIFYDYQRANSQTSANDFMRLAERCLQAFIQAYSAIITRRCTTAFTDSEKYFHLIRRGRYVEFNLIHDRGTLFGLKTGGRIESILMSLPPEVRWDYNYPIHENSREAELVHVLKHPKDWV